jgi:hypothetical protein
MKRFSVAGMWLLLSLSALAQEVNPIVNDKVTVPARSFWYQGVEVRWDRAVIQGRFRAEGGSGNDIIVYVLDEDGFENFKNKHQTPTHYNSGKVTVGTIRAIVGPGNYYIVLDNQFSNASNKVVAIQCQAAELRN